MPTSLDELERLLAEATPGPWEEERQDDTAKSAWTEDMARAGIEATHVHSMGTIWALGIIVASFPAYDKRKALADAAVTTALRNEAPRLLAMARAGERMYRASSQLDMAASKGHVGYDHPLSVQFRGALAAWREVRDGK